MATSTLIVDYLGVGLAVNLPVAPNVPSTGSAFYYETDTPALRVWDGSAWQPVIVGAASGTVTHTGGALTDHGILVGNGTDDIAALGVMTDGQLLIGHTGADPDLATLTAGTGITITNAAGSITITAQNLGTVTHTGGALTANGAAYATGAADIASTGALTDGQFLIGRTGLAPVAGVIAGSTGIAVTNTPGGIIIATDATVGTLHSAGPLTTHAVIVGYDAGDISNGPVLTDGQVLLGVTGSDPIGVTIASGSGVTVTSTGGGITVSLPNTAVTPGSYGDATHVGTFTVDAKGRLTAAASTAITFPSSGTGTVTHTAGALTAHAPIVGNGSADEKALAAMTDGQLMIGVTGADPALATLTAGTNITITNAAGAITIDSSNGGGTVTHTGGALTNHAPLVGAGTDDAKALAAMTNGQLLIGNTGSDPSLASLTAGLAISITPGGGSITVAGVVMTGDTGTGGVAGLAPAPASGDAAAGKYLDAAGGYSVPPGTGTGTVTHTAGNLTAHAFISGNAGGDLKATGAATNGQLLIGSTGADPVAASLTAGAGVTITPGAGSITIAATGTATLAGATDANISSPANLDVLKYQTSDSKWHNVTLGALLDGVFGTTQGQVLYRDAANWAALGPGGAGSALITLGAGANPRWGGVLTGSNVDSLGNTLIPGIAVDCATVNDTSVAFGSGYTYANGTAGVGATLTAPGNGAVSIDGFSLNAIGQRALMKDMKTLKNGVYSVTTVGDASHTLVLTRVTDFDTAAEMLAGSAFFVLNGSANAGSYWSLAYTVTTVGTTVPYFTQVTGSVPASSGGSTTTGRGLWSGALSAAVPTIASTGLDTWSNQGSATVADTDAGIFLDVDSAHSGLAVRQTSSALPGTPYSFTALISGGPFFSESTGVMPVGLGWTDGTKLHLGYSIGDGGNSINVTKWNSTTSVSANEAGGTYLSVRSGLTWWKILDDGTNVKWYSSNDGVNFVLLFSIAKASGWLGTSGYTKVCFIAGPNTFAHEVGATLMSWKQGTS